MQRQAGWHINYTVWQTCHTFQSAYATPATPSHPHLLVLLNAQGRQLIQHRLLLLCLLQLCLLRIRRLLLSLLGIRLHLLPLFCQLLIAPHINVLLLKIHAPLARSSCSPAPH